jgi:hypothetical protein
MTSPFLICRDCTCSALRRASRSVTQHFEAHFRGTGLRVTQFTVLAALVQTGPLAISLLAAEGAIERWRNFESLGCPGKADYGQETNLT